MKRALATAVGLCAVLAALASALAPGRCGTPIRCRPRCSRLISFAAAGSGAKFDIPVLPAEEGLAVVAKAVDLLLDNSAFSAGEIRKLASKGRVIVAYDPAFPKKQLTQLTIAAFFPDFYKKDGAGKDFVAIVGRYGVKWPPRELAAIIAHELVGHGMQHYRGRMEHVRNVDLECEAYLYEENAYQTLGISKHTEEMIKFRRVLEQHWCRDFRQWTQKNEPKKMALWDTLNPNVPAILKVYLRYIEDLRKSGVAGRAVAAARAAQQAESKAQVARLSRSKSPEDHYKLGMIHLRGLGVAENPKLASVWFEKAAIKGHAKAQDSLASLYYKGHGVKKNLKQAARWYRQAAGKGIINAQAVYGAMLVNGKGVKRNLAEGLKWLEKAAAGGHAKAKKAVPTVRKIIAKRKKQG